jgi:16S rRNA (cytosine1402-N4)-methyltransferase
MTELSGGAVHIPVLLNEVLEVLGAGRGGMYLECTFGGGGHTRALLDAHPDTWVVALDRDARAIERGRGWAAKYGDRLELVHTPYSDVLQKVSFRGFDGVLADLGMSTDQLREERGFSFADHSALDMRMDETTGASAQEFLNTAAEREIYIALARGGVGTTARQLARVLVSKRPFTSAQELAEVVRGSQLGKRSVSRVHPATVVFQALRMHVNQELQEIETLLDVLPVLVKNGGKLAVITFHSIEDRLVANTMRGWESAGTYPASWRGPRDEKRIGVVSPKKPIVPTDEEVSCNAASRSARLRVFEFVK